MSNIDSNLESVPELKLKINLLQIDVIATILAFAITFTIVMTLLLSLGFGSVGIGAGKTVIQCYRAYQRSQAHPWIGTAAAMWQAWAYGALTPAGGIFATLTSMGMLSLLAPPFGALALVVALMVATLVWRSGLWRPV